MKFIEFRTNVALLQIDIEVLTLTKRLLTLLGRLSILLHQHINTNKATLSLKTTVDLLNLVIKHNFMLIAGSAKR